MFRCFGTMQYQSSATGLLAHTWWVEYVAAHAVNIASVSHSYGTISHPEGCDAELSIDVTFTGLNAAQAEAEVEHIYEAIYLGQRPLECLNCAADCDSTFGTEGFPGAPAP